MLADQSFHQQHHLQPICLVCPAIIRLTNKDRESQHPPVYPSHLSTLKNPQETNLTMMFGQVQAK